MEFAPSLDIVTNETLPALQKVHNYNLCSWSGNNFILNALLSPTSMQKESYHADEETFFKNYFVAFFHLLIMSFILANFFLGQAVMC